MKISDDNVQSFKAKQSVYAGWENSSLFLQPEPSFDEKKRTTAAIKHHLQLKYRTDLYYLMVSQSAKVPPPEDDMDGEPAL